MKQLYGCYPILTDFFIIDDIAKNISSIINLEKQNEYHITLIYSSNLINDKLVNHYLMNRFMCWHNPIITLGKLELFGDMLVILIETDRLIEEFNYIKDNFNASWDFPDYKPHISLGKINPEDFIKLQEFEIKPLQIKTDMFKLDDLETE